MDAVVGVAARGEGVATGGDNHLARLVDGLGSGAVESGERAALEALALAGQL